MNGGQDLGGVMGLGPVAPEPNEPVYHADWEKRALGLTLCAGALGAWNIDISRHARENRHPADYLASSYYEIWIKGLEKLLVERGLASAAEIAAGKSLTAPAATRRPKLIAADVPATLARGGPCDRPLESKPRFAVGAVVRCHNDHPIGHTRLPRYIRGRLGRIETIQGGYVFPDTNAHDRGEDPQWVYSVAFDGEELWGAAATPGLSVAVDCWGILS